MKDVNILAILDNNEIRYKEAQTDSLGRAVMSFKKTLEPILFTFQKDYSTYAPRLFAHLNFEMDIFLSGVDDFQGNPIKYVRQAFKIIKIKKDYFVLEEAVPRKVRSTYRKSQLLE